MPAINFFSEDIDFSLKHSHKISNWIKDSVKTEGKTIAELNFIFCSDSYLHKINLEYLNHDTFTDIVTFDNSEQPGILEGDIFISIERVRENAIRYESVFERELNRVIIHGVLHLLGYKDKSSADKAKMRRREEAYLSLLSSST